MSENIIELLPPEIKQIIFSYLEASDLLSLSSVCKSFNEFIGQSQDIMKIFWIKFYTFKMKDMESLAASSRNYEKLKVNRVNKSEHFKFLTDLEKPWKKILIYNCEFKKTEILYEFIESFSESIRELEISDIEILNNDLQICPLKFPNLKRVMFRNVPASVIEIFQLSKNLKNASFNIAQPAERYLSINKLLYNFLNNCEKLKHLQLGPHYIKNLFDQENIVISMRYQFELEKLMLKFPIIRDESPDIEINVCKFLKGQQKVQWILFIEMQNEAILCEAWNKVNSVNHLSFVGLEGLFDGEMDLAMEPNFNIIYIELLSRKLLISQLRKIFAAAPNLKSLHVHTLTKYVMEFTARNHHNLQQLTYETFEEEAFEIYNQLKSSSDLVNENIELKKVSFWRDIAEPSGFTLDPFFWHS